MKKASFGLLLLILAVGCEKKSDELQVGMEWAHLTGAVKYAEDLTPVGGAYVRTQTHLQWTYTDTLGIYDLAIEVLKDQQENVILEVYKEGFLAVNLPAIAQAGSSTNLPVITMERYLDSTITDTNIASGSAASIALISLNPETLSVAGAGGFSSSQIVCEVRDLAGNAVDTLNAAQVNFELVVDPGGDAHVYPPSVVTDENGQVSTTLFAGSLAGVAIVKAQFATGATFIVLPDVIIYQTGEPASINLVGLEYDSIAVQGTGANSTSTLTFEVRDAGGSPITALNPTAVDFQVQTGPDSGEYLYPTSAITDAEGRVSTTLNSGMQSGVVQILAELADDITIACSPVPVVIHSGFPDANHFAVVPRYVNCPGYNVYGVVDSIIAIVADIYGNPVPMGTAVFFSTTSGVIEGSGTTDPGGFAPVKLVSGPPSPPPSNPFGIITAQTVGQGGQLLTDNTAVLFSGYTVISELNPPNFNIPDYGSQTFTFTVSDQNGWPISSGSHLTIEATTGGLMGDIDVIFPDTQSPAWTHFGFVLFDNDPGDSDSTAAVTAVSIYVSSPNGDASEIINGLVD